MSAPELPGSGNQSSSIRCYLNVWENGQTNAIVVWSFRGMKKSKTMADDNSVSYAWSKATLGQVDILPRWDNEEMKITKWNQDALVVVERIAS